MIPTSTFLHTNWAKSVLAEEFRIAWNEVKYTEVKKDVDMDEASKNRLANAMVVNRFG